MEKIEQLKTIEIDKISNEQVSEHVKNVLELNDETSIVEYLIYALDTYYKNIEEGDNTKGVDLFFATEEFKPYYELMRNVESPE